MKQLHNFLTIFSLSFLLLSCSKEYSDESGSNLIPVGWSTSEPSILSHPARVVLNNLQPADIKFTFNNITGAFLPVTPLTVIVPTNCFVKMNNSPVSGNVELTIKKATKFSEMILYNLVTLTNNELLSTDGMMHLSAKQGTEQLKIAPTKKITLIFPRSSSNGYTGFSGKENNTVVNNITWTENTTWPVDTATIQGGGTNIPGTRIQIDSMQWVNCDYFYNVPNPTNVYLELPSTYGNANTVCYALFRADKVMIGLKPDVLNQRFWQGAPYKVPIGKPVRLIAISKKDNKTYYGSIDGSITADMTLSITTMEEVTEIELQNRLNAL